GSSRRSVPCSDTVRGSRQRVDGALFAPAGRRVLGFGGVLRRRVAARIDFGRRFAFRGRRGGRRGGKSGERRLHALPGLGDALLEALVRVPARRQLRAQRFVLVGEAAYDGENLLDAFAELLDFLGCLIHGAMVYEAPPR